ncbi:MAG: SRPBCC domain-containing protein [Bacteroidota bacterium]
MNNPASNNDRIVTIKRTFQAPIELVWEAWTQPQHIASWWGPPGMDVKVEEHDLRVGGSWRYTMMMPDGNAFVSEGVYTEIVPPHRLVTTANFRPMTEGVTLEIELASSEEGTAFTFHVIHPTVAYKEQQEKMGIYNGWGGAFDRLELFLSS